MLNNAIIEKENEFVYQTYGRLPIAIKNAIGSYIFDMEDNKYLDFLSGIAVTALGHSHPSIIDAIEKQLHQYLHVSNYFYQEPQIELAEKLIKHTGMSKVYFSNSGAEAVEGAIKLLRKWGKNTKREMIYSMPDAFHGRTTGALSLMQQEKYREDMGPFFDDMQVLEPNLLLEGKYDNAIAVIFEPIQGEGGISEISEEIIDALKKMQKNGCLLVVDEIQAGIGRTGKYFSYQHYNIKPDVVLTAKALGGGLPVGAIIVDENLTEVFQKGNHGSTFGGNALACAAGIAVINELDSGLLDDVNDLGKYFHERLIDLQGKFADLISEIRGKGLMLGIKFSIDPIIIRDKLIEKNILTCTASNMVLRLLPPLTVNKEEIDIFIEKITWCLNEIEI